MNNELRSGRLIGYIFAIPCIFAIVVIVHQTTVGNNLLPVLPFFILGLAAGISLLIRPKVLVRVINSQMELFPGSLWGNSCQVRVPLQDIDDIEVKKIAVNGGMSWALTLNLNKEQNLSESAIKWILTFTRNSELKNSLPNRLRLHWPLSWPEGGSTKSEQKLKMLTSRV